MTSLGRGRGWATAQGEKPALRRPGTVPVQTFDCTGLINEITRIKEDDDIQQITLDVNARFTNVEKDNIKTIMSKLYSTAMNDRKFGQNFIRIFTNHLFNQIIDNLDMNARRYVISAMQADFERKEDLMKENAAQCRNAAYLLFDGFKYMRSSSRPAAVFILGAFGYLQLFLETPTIENLEVFADQMIKFGEELEEVDKKAFDSLMVNVRKSLITENHPALARALLLFILDLSNCKFKCSSLPKDIRILYSQQFGESASMFLGNCVEETIEPSETESTSPPVPSNKAVPRAIRGSGATRIQSVQRKTRASPSSSRRIGEKKGWDHDDRFEKDYSY